MCRTQLWMIPAVRNVRPWRLTQTFLPSFLFLPRSGDISRRKWTWQRSPSLLLPRRRSRGLIRVDRSCAPKEGVVVCCPLVRRTIVISIYISYTRGAYLMLIARSASGVNRVMVNRLRICELCGARFVDDDHKDDHLNSCPKLPIFHEIESFNHEPPGKFSSPCFS